MTRSVHVRAPCRLHFGMLSFGHTDQPQFGGVGAMIDPPAVEVEIRSAPSLHLRGELAQRVHHFVESVAQHWRLSDLPACEITVRSPPNHTGLGVGTQLGLAVAAGLRRFLDLLDLPSHELAMSVGRGARSAVGAYGFQHGGLLVDAGKRAGDPLGILAHRLALPEAWRFVLVSPTNRQGLAGESEAGAFERLPPVPPAVTQELWRLTEKEILPAVERADCTAFGEAVYRFGRLAGECFAPVQGGPFADPLIAELVSRIRNFGVSGVGQSSWGPTVFAVVPHDAEAEKLAGSLRENSATTTHEILIAKPNNHGATITVT